MKNKETSPLEFTSYIFITYVITPIVSAFAFGMIYIVALNFIDLPKPTWMIEEQVILPDNSMEFIIISIEGVGDK